MSYTQKGNVSHEETMQHMVSLCSYSNVGSYGVEEGSNLTDINHATQKRITKKCGLL